MEVEGHKYARADPALHVHAQNGFHTAIWHGTTSLEQTSSLERPHWNVGLECLHWNEA
jgi:hypothetical protein